MYALYVYTILNVRKQPFTVLVELSDGTFGVLTIETKAGDTWVPLANDPDKTRYATIKFANRAFQDIEQQAKAKKAV